MSPRPLFFPPHTLSQMSRAVTLGLRHQLLSGGREHPCNHISQLSPGGRCPALGQMNLNVKPQLTKLGLQSVAECFFKCVGWQQISVGVISFRDWGSPLQQANVFWWDLVCGSLWTHPAPVTPVALATTHQVPPLLCLGEHLWKPEWWWRTVSGVILGNETYKVSVVRENVFLVFLILCSWAVQIQSRPLQVTPSHALSLGSMPFPTVSLNCPSAWNLQRWELLDYLTSSGNCYDKQNQWLSIVCWACFSCVLSEFLPAAASPCIGTLPCFVPLLAAPTLMETMSGEQDQVLARDGSGYRCNFPHLHPCCHSASHSSRALCYPYGLCPLGGRWQWFKNYFMALHQGRVSCYNVFWWCIP